MLNTTPAARAELLARFPELADYARAAVRLHPRRGVPTVGESSVGGPLLWPQDEPWPLCHEDHEFPEPQRTTPPGDTFENLRQWQAQSTDPDLAAHLGSMAALLESPQARQAEPARPTARVTPDGLVVMASVLQLYRRDLPGETLERRPEWMFPHGTDVLQVLWCPNPHPDTYDPRVRMYWRTQAEIGATREANPPLNLSWEKTDVCFLPESCRLHPELVEEYPPVLITHPDEVDPDSEEFTGQLLGKLPEDLERACWAWTADSGPYHDEDDTGNDYTTLSGAPGWKLGGWVPYVGFAPEPAEHCACGAPTFLLLAALCFEEPGGPWQPREQPGFPWRGPDPETSNGPTGVWGGRNGQMWLMACTADPTHPILTYHE
jgi:hypothetical protein